MTVTLVLPDSIAVVIQNLVTLEIETAGVLLARMIHSPDGNSRLLARDLRLVGEDAYVRREAQALEIKSHGYVPALRHAEESASIPIWVHTHPGRRSSSQPSKHDKRVNEQLSDVFRLRAGSPYYGAAIFSPSDSGLRFTAMLDDGQTATSVDRLLTIGPRLSLQWSEDMPLRPLATLFDRNIKAFGGDVQRTLGDLRIAVVGCGGTGSAVVEQLIRLGVRHLTLIDPDRLSDSNLTRVYGSGALDVGRPKVEILTDHALRIAPDATIVPVSGSITSESIARHLIGADLVFGCTDDNAGRLVLSRIATYLIKPVIDCGVLLSTDAHQSLDGIFGRVTVLYPGAACLVCRNRVDLTRAASEMLTPSERVRRVDEGYAPALEGIEPAVVAYTTLVAAMAVGELLERLIGYGPEPPPSEIVLRLHEREVSSNRQEPRLNHYCHPDTGKVGLGETTPFLEQTWQG